eukprot:gene12100-18693_t
MPDESSYAMDVVVHNTLSGQTHVFTAAAHETRDDVTQRIGDFWSLALPPAALDLKFRWSDLSVFDTPAALLSDTAVASGDEVDLVLSTIGLAIVELRGRGTEPGAEGLKKAITDDDTELVDLMCRANVLPAFEKAHGEPAWVFAASLKLKGAFTAIVSYCYKHDPSSLAYAKDKQKQRSPLMWAAMFNDVASVEKLMTLSDVNAVDGKNMTALHQACYTGSFAAAQVLVRLPECDVNARWRPIGITALIIAVSMAGESQELVNLVQSLISRPDTDIWATDRTSFRWKASDYALS